MGPWLSRAEARCLAPFAFWAAIAARVLISSLLLLVATSGSPAAEGDYREASQPQGPAAHGRPGKDYSSLIANLRAAGARVEAGEQVVQPFFSVKGRVIRVNGEDAQVFQYRNAAQSDAQAALISSDGMTIGSAKVHWLGPPHFFKKDRLIVLYVGQNDQVLRALAATLGRQFAGAQY